MHRDVLYFSGPRAVEVRREPLAEPTAGQVRVRTTCSGVSAGTELLVYRGEAPEGLAADAHIDALSGRLAFPLAYGYSAVGRVEALGSGVDARWTGRRVFAFQPHASHFVADPASLVPLPEAVAGDEAVFIPNVETAVNLVMDGRPMVGERVAVFGQGIVGLLTTAVLARFPLDCLVTLDPLALRRRWSERLGADASLDPAASNAEARLRELLGWSVESSTGAGGEGKASGHNGEGYEGADLCYELSGRPSVLDDALRVVGFTGRIVVGSWYGKKKARLDLGGRFHRGRHRIVSSQVSTIGPELGGRWTKSRRMQTVLGLLPVLDPRRLITHRVSIEDAASAYERLDQKNEHVLQIVFEYDKG